MSRLARIRSLAVGLALVLSSGNCTDGPTEPKQRLAAITVELSQSSIRVYESVRAVAHGRDEAGNAVGTGPVSWSTTPADRSSLTTYPDSAAVEAYAEGSLTITARSGAIQGTAQLTILPAIVASVSLGSSSRSIVRGDTLRLYAVLKNVRGLVMEGREVSWHSSDSSIATVTSSGLVSAGAAGKAIIRATVGDVTATVDLTVLMPVAKVVVQPATVAIDYGDTIVLAATLTDESGAELTGRRVTWRSDTLSIAAVDSVGRVVATGIGRTGVTATSEGRSGSASVEVRPPAISARRSTLSAGQDGTCALASSRPYCWGGEWQRGAVVFPASGPAGGLLPPTPTAVLGNLSLVAVSASALRTCGVDEGGQVYCWSRYAPRREETGGVRFVTVSVANDHLCGLSVDAQVYCWGSNSEGQLGTGDLAARSLPTRVPLPEPASDVAARALSSCALTQSGRLYCWGYWFYGSLSGGSRPQLIRSAHPLVSLSLGTEHVCGIDVFGVVGCAGGNSFGALGRGVVGGYEVDIAPVSSNERFVDVSAGSAFTCAISRDGRVYCWGLGTDGELGDGSLADRSMPTLLQGLASATEVSAGFRHTCARLNGDRIRCWGDAAKGQTGDGWPASGGPLAPAQVQLPGRAIAVAGGGSTTCASTEDQKGYCWGNGYRGQWGDGATANARYRPSKAVAGNVSLRALAVGRYHVCGLSASGEAYCWGSDEYGEATGVASYRYSIPTKVATPYRFSSLTIGLYHTCGLTTDSLAVCWGANSKNQLGIGGVSATARPTAVASTERFVRISAGLDQTCALSAAGVAFCWGAWSSAFLSGTPMLDGTFAVPTRVTAAPPLSRISVGSVTTCGVSVNAQVFCWGRVNGAFGVSPTLVAVAEGVQAVAVGFANICALGSSGSLYCWGDGPIGDGTSVAQPLPVRVGGGSRYREVSAGDWHMCALDTNDAVQCWGDNAAGQLGTASTIRPAPVIVGAPFN